MALFDSLYSSTSKEFTTIGRLSLAAFSGFLLAECYTGIGFAIGSWVFVMLLLLPLFGARGRVAFSSGFLHGLVFVLTSLYWIAIVLEVHGGLSHLGGIGVLLLIDLAWGVLTGILVILLINIVIVWYLAKNRHRLFHHHHQREAGAS